MGWMQRGGLGVVGGWEGGLGLWCGGEGLCGGGGVASPRARARISCDLGLGMVLCVGYGFVSFASYLRALTS